MNAHQAQSNLLQPKKRARPLRVLDRVYGTPAARPQPAKRIHAERVRSAMNRGWVFGWAVLVWVLVEIQRDPPQGVTRPLTLFLHPAPIPAPPTPAARPRAASQPSAGRRSRGTKPVHIISLVLLAIVLISTLLHQAHIPLGYTTRSPGNQLAQAILHNAPDGDKRKAIASTLPTNAIQSSPDAPEQNNHLSRTALPEGLLSSQPTSSVSATAPQPSTAPRAPQPTANRLAPTAPANDRLPSVGSVPAAPTAVVPQASGNPTIALPQLPTSGGEGGGDNPPTNTPVPTDTPVPTVQPTDTPEPTAQPSSTPVPIVRATDTPLPTVQPTNTPVPTVQPTNTPLPTVQPTNTPLPTVQPTNTPLPTVQPTNTPLPTVQPTNTPVPTTQPSSTPVPLPTPCPDPQQPINVILLIDRSSSMTGQKIASAKQAAGMFVKLLDLGVHQIGIVTFARSAQLDSVLTHDANALQAKLDAITTSSGTNIAAGLAMAADQLNRDSHTDAKKVIILLSDGHASVQASQTMTEANNAKAAQISIFTIALGNNADEATLSDIASAPDLFYKAPNPALLDDIYIQIAQALVGCRANQPAAPSATPVATPTTGPLAPTAIAHIDTAGAPPAQGNINADPTGDVVPCLVNTIVSSAQPDLASERDGRLKISANARELWALIRCQAGGDLVDDVKLRLFVTGGTGDGVVRSVLDPWSEQTSWRTRPRLGDTVARFSGAAERHWIEVDVTSALQADGSIVVAVQATGAHEFELAALEHSALGPQLVVVR